VAKVALIERELKRDKLVAKYAQKYAERTFRQFGLGRAKIREMAFAGQIPGITKASW